MSPEPKRSRSRHPDLLEDSAPPRPSERGADADGPSDADPILTNLQSPAADPDISGLGSRKSLRRTNARIRVPVTGMVELTPLEVAVVDTRTFQRLRKIRQLGGTYVVYPGANHSRFEHCLGVVAMAARMCDAVAHNMQASGTETRQITPEDRKIIRLAALLHDVGHLAFGHTLEDEVRLFTKHDSEERLQQLLLEGEIAEVFETYDNRATLEEVVAVLRKNAPDRLPADRVFRADIVANTVCADLLDYLKRDIYHVGLNYAYDERLFEYMILAPDRQGRTRFAIRLVKGGKLRHDAVTQIFELLNLRYILAEAVLFHHAKDAHSAMLSRALLESEFLLNLVCASVSDEEAARMQAAYSEERGSQVPLYFAGERKPEPDEILWLGDDELIARLGADKNPITACLARLMESRQLYRMHAYIDFHAARHADAQDRIIKDLHQHPEQRFQVERQIEEELALPRGSILLYCPSAGMNAKVAEVHIVVTDTAVPLAKYEDDNQRVLTAGFLDAQIQRFHGLWRTYLFVHPSLPINSADRAARYLRARYYLFGNGTTTMSETQREAQRESEFRNLAAEIFGESNPNISYARVQELRSPELVTIESRLQDSTRKVRQYLEAFALEGRG
jgi:HD superfamily phosphohydrolase